MSSEEGKRPQSRREQVGQPAQTAPESAGVPGKRTLTMNVPARPGPALPVQRKPARATELARSEQAEMTAQWVNTAMRPDIYPPPVQRKAAAAAAEHAPSRPASGSGYPLPEDVRAKMEGSFGTDFSAVRLHEGPHVRSMGALAYTQGTDIHFAPAQRDSGSQRGQELLGHELAHVVQQAEGRVSTTTQAKGLAINDDASLEKEADEMGAKAARGERIERASRSSPNVSRAITSGRIQRFAFINEEQVKPTETDLTTEVQDMVSDDVIRNYSSMDELEEHASKQTDYLGNLPGGTWVNFSPAGINLLGENHTLVTLKDVVPAVGSTSFIYEPFSTDDLSEGSHMKTAYETENQEKFELLGVGEEQDKRQFGAESLFPKIGFALTIAIPYFEGNKPITALGSSEYVGQPIQRYLKIAWAHSKDNDVLVREKQESSEQVPPKMAKLVLVHGEVAGLLDSFLTSLPVDGYIGDALAKENNPSILAALAVFSKAFTEAMVEMATFDESSRLSSSERERLGEEESTSAKDKMKLFAQWRNHHFEDAVRAAAKRGVRYAGMGQLHLDYLEKVGFPENAHPYEMAGKDIEGFKTLTSKLAKKAVKD